jgi:hypothetical protein
MQTADGALHTLTQYSAGVSVARAIELTKLQFPLFWRVCDSNNIGMQQRRPQRMQLFAKHNTCSNMEYNNVSAACRGERFDIACN